MDARNGTGGVLAPPARKRYSVVPEYRTIEIERPNPNYDPDQPGSEPTIVAALRAWPKGPRCPTWVEIEVESANDTFRAAISEIESEQAADGTANTYARATLPVRAAGTTYHRELLAAVVEGLTPDDLQILCSDGGPWAEILTDLGWWRLPSPDQLEAAPDPEVTTEATASFVDSSPVSVPSTDPTTG